MTNIRTDVETDKQQVFCPNSSLIGFSKHNAQFGDLLQWQTPEGHVYIGRMIGRVKYAEDYDKPNQPIRNHIIVCVISDSLSFVMERWIKPEWVTNITPKDRLPEVREVMEAFLSEELTRYSSSILRQWCASGWRTFSKFLGSIAPRVTKED